MTIMKFSGYPQAKTTIIKNMLILLDQYPIDRITVTKICSMSHINRSTFYAYFVDIYDLYQQIINEYLDCMEPFITDNPTEQSLLLLFQSILTTVKEDKLFAIILSSPRIAIDSLYKYLSVHEHKVISEWMKKFPSLPQFRLKYLYTSTTMGCSAAIQRWIRGGFTEDIADICTTLTVFCNNAMLSLESV